MSASQSVELGGGKQALDGRSAATGAFRAGEQLVRHADGVGADSVVERRVVDRQAARCQVTQQCRLAVERVADCLDRTAAERHGTLACRKPGTRFRQRTQR